jgi:hypothetical protein
LALYGGVVRGRYQSGRSDINLLVLLKELNTATLERHAPVLQSAWREIHLEPFLVAQPELERTAAVFPTKMLDVQRFHRLVAGEDVLKSLQVRPADLSRRVEQELRNLTMRLRRRFLSIHQDEGAMQRVLVDAAVTLRVNFLALLYLASVAVPDEERTAAAFAAAAERFKLDGAALLQLSELRKTGSANGQVRALYGAILEVAAQAASLVTRME